MIPTNYLPSQSLGNTLASSYVGGFSQWYYTFIENLDSFPTVDPLTQQLIAEPTLKSGKTWYGPVNVPINATGFNETSQRAKGGIYYKQKLVSSMPGFNANAHINLENIIYHQIVIVGKLRSGGFWVIAGTDKKGFDIDTETDTGSGNRAIAINKITLNNESLSKAMVLPSFNGLLNTAPPIGTTIITVTTGSGGSDPEFIDFNISGDTTIVWDGTRLAKYGAFPTIEIFAINDAGAYYLANMAVDVIGNPPTQFIIRNAGGIGKIKIS